MESSRSAKSIGLTSDQTAELVGLNHELLTNGGNYAQVGDKVQLLTTSLDTLSETGGQAASSLSAEQQNLITRIFDANGALGQQIKQNADAQAAFELLASTEAHVTTETVKMWEAQNKAADSAREAANAGLAYKDALAQLKTAHEGTTEALKKNGENSEQYQAALRGEEHSILAVLDAKKAEGVANSKANNDILKLHDGTVAQNAEAVKLAGTYKGTLPDALRTAISSIGVADAAAAGLKISVNEAGQAVYELPDGRTIVISGDVKQAKDAIDSVPTYAAGKKGAIPIGADVNEATGKIDQTIQYADGSTGVVSIDGDKDPATGKIFAAVTLANGQHTYMNIDAINQGAKDKTIEVVRFADGSVGYVQVKANTAAAEAAINQVARDRTGHITMIVRTDGSVRVGGGNNIMNAKGNIVEHYAAGGLKPMRGGVASIVPPRTWRVVGDRMVDDEAYIPINRASRSVGILQETARRMGFELMRRYAAGGIAQSPSINVPLSTPSGPMKLTGRIDIGGTLFDLVDAQIQAADHANGDALYRGRRS